MTKIPVLSQKYLNLIPDGEKIRHEARLVAKRLLIGFCEGV